LSVASAPADEEAGDIKPPKLFASPVFLVAFVNDFRHEKYEGLISRSWICGSRCGVLLGLLRELLLPPADVLRGNGFDGDVLEDIGVGYILLGSVWFSSSSYSDTE